MPLIVAGSFAPVIGPGSTSMLVFTSRPLRSTPVRAQFNAGTVLNLHLVLTQALRQGRALGGFPAIWRDGVPGFPKLCPKPTWRMRVATRRLAVAGRVSCGTGLPPAGDSGLERAKD
jgi:hypothetical protein